MQASVDAQSAPVEKLVKRDVPSANAAKHAVAVADGFVAGQAQASEDVASWADNAFLRGAVDKGTPGIGVSLEFSGNEGREQERGSDSETPTRC